MKSAQKEKQILEGFLSFCTWSPEEIEQQVDSLKRQWRDTMVRFCRKENPTIVDVPVFLDSSDSVCSDVFDQLYLLGLVSPSKKVRDISFSSEEELRREALRLTSSDNYAKAFKKVEVPEDLDSEVGRLYTLVKDKIRQAGQFLPPKKRRRYLEIKSEINALATRFAKNLTVVDEVWLTKGELAGVPESILETLTTKDGQYQVTTEYSSALPVLRYAEDSETRKRVHTLFSRRGGEENKRIFAQVIALRQEAAVLIGYQNHAQGRLQTLTAGSVENVKELVNTVLTAVRPSLRKEQGLLLEEKRSMEGATEFLYAWDVAFYSRSLQEKIFGLDSEKLREYFALDNVLEAMFGYFSELFGVVISEIDLSVWHEDVRTYEVRKDDRLVGYISLDLLPREGKYKHACAASVVTGIQDEVAFSVVVANFRRPVNGKPVTVSFGEITTIFHEIGHIFHNTFGRSRFFALSGFRTVWDFIEVPSQLLEQWAWDKDLITNMARHITTGEVLPTEKIEALLESKNFLNGHFFASQLAYINFDLLVHEDGLLDSDLTQVWHDVRTEIGLPNSEEDIFPASFSHVITSQYDAAYYSYLYSLVYALDMYQVIQDSKDPNIGNIIREELLEVAATRPESITAEKVLGRKVSIKNFLKIVGLVDEE